MIRILYFASLRERVGCADETFDPTPTHSLTVADLADRLAARGGAWAEAFAADARPLSAVNQAMARPSTPISDGDEVAFFPPVTGG
ncbi:molybdopterin converting factor subunit 1 [Thioalkalicoccus limnaeus]|uniref:Molybdopterin synthase sulfur carrier subunit n=1 Tax=Thioalkalicoccus limnaeus TaxID=120681 RepID=A0ABV4BB88_9GAMM